MADFLRLAAVLIAVAWLLSTDAAVHAVGKLLGHEQAGASGRQMGYL